MSDEETKTTRVDVEFSLEDAAFPRADRIVGTSDGTLRAEGLQVEYEGTLSDKDVWSGIFMCLNGSRPCFEMYMYSRQETDHE